MSEKLSAFATLYTEKAAADVEAANEYVKTSEANLKKAEELWNTLNAESTKLGITDKFLSAFPEPGGKANVTLGSSGANPNYMALLQYGDPMDSLVRELTKLTSPKKRFEAAKNSLAFAEELVKRKPEDHIKILSSAIVETLAKSASLGVEPIGDLLKLIFNSYDDYSDIIYQIDGADGPSSINSSQQAYDVLKEQFDAGSFTNKQAEPTQAIGETPELGGETANPQESSINLPESMPVEKTEVESAGGIVSSSPVEVPSTTPEAEKSTEITINVDQEVGKTKEGPDVISTETQPSISNTTTSTINNESDTTTNEFAKYGIDTTKSLSELNSYYSQVITPPGENTTSSVSNTTNINSPVNNAGPEYIDVDKELTASSPSTETTLNSPSTEKKSGEVFSSDEKELLSSLGFDMNISSKEITNSYLSSLGVEPSNNMEVTKTNTTLEREKTSTSNIEKINEVNNSVQAGTSESTQKITEVKSEPSVNQGSPEQTTVPTQTGAATRSSNVSIDISALESRLKRLEVLLSSPLDVRIIQ